ncbi:TPA: YlcG family protein [Escherichia coli]|nr:YlcG family protein [Escherichia coli]HCT6530858.1 YlcG family protein [Escherichia coli]
MMFESYMAERLRRRWVRLRLYRFLGSVLTDYRILKNYAKTLKGAAA